MFTGMIFGVLLGGVLSWLTSTTVYERVDADSMGKTKIRKDFLYGWVVGFVVFFGVAIGFMYLGKTIANYNLQLGIEKHIAIQQTYESAIADERLTGFERLELSKTAIEQNSAIAMRKVGLRRWWSFGLQEHLILQYEALRPIGVES